MMSYLLGIFRNKILKIYLNFHVSSLFGFVQILQYVLYSFFSKNNFENFTT